MGTSSKDTKKALSTQRQAAPLTSRSQQVKQAISQYMDQNPWVYTTLHYAKICAAVIALILIAVTLAILLTPAAPLLAARNRISDSSLRESTAFLDVSSGLPSTAEISAAGLHDALRASQSSSKRLAITDTAADTRTASSSVSLKSATSNSETTLSRVVNFFSLPSFPAAAAGAVKSKLGEQDELCLRDQNKEKHPSACVQVAETYAKAILNILAKDLPNSLQDTFYFKRPSVSEVDFWDLMNKISQAAADPIKLQLYHRICISRFARAYLFTDDKDARFKLDPKLKMEKTAYLIAYAAATYAYNPNSPLPIYIFASAAAEYPAVASIYRNISVEGSKDLSFGIQAALRLMQNTKAIINKLKSPLSKRTEEDQLLLSNAFQHAKNGHLKPDPADPWEMKAFEAFVLTGAVQQLTSDTPEISTLSPMFAAMAHGTEPMRKQPAQMIPTPHDYAFEIEAQADAFEQRLAEKHAAKVEIVTREQQRGAYM